MQDRRPLPRRVQPVPLRDGASARPVRGAWRGQPGGWPHICVAVKRSTSDAGGDRESQGGMALESPSLSQRHTRAAARARGEAPGAHCSGQGHRSPASAGGVSGLKSALRVPPASARGWPCGVTLSCCPPGNSVPTWGYAISHGPSRPLRTKVHPAARSRRFSSLVKSLATEQCRASAQDAAASASVASPGTSDSAMYHTRASSSHSAAHVTNMTALSRDGQRGARQNIPVAGSRPLHS
jgi:hypothetical protein